MPGRLDSGHVPLRPLTLSGPCAVPATETRTPLYVEAKCGRPNWGSTRALTTGTSVEVRRFYPLGHGEYKAAGFRSGRDKVLSHTFDLLKANQRCFLHSLKVWFNARAGLMPGNLHLDEQCCRHGKLPY